MSSYLVLQRTSFALRDILWNAIKPVPPILNIFPSPQSIAFINPTATLRDQSVKLSLWMYQVTENEFMKNQPPSRPINGGPNTEVKTPLALNLYYLVTPFSLSAEQDLQILGFVMQVFYDNPTIYINDPANGVFEELRLIMCRLTLEELTRVWEALREPYHLSMCYKVTVAQIESTAITQKARVVEADNDYGTVPALIER